MKYEQVYDGQWWKIDGRSLKMMCCDCNLVHDISIRVNPDNTMSMRYDVNRPATRRARKRYGVSVIRSKP